MKGYDITHSEKKTLYVNVYRDGQVLYMAPELFESLEMASKEIDLTYQSYVFTVSISGIASTIVRQDEA